MLSFFSHNTLSPIWTLLFFFYILRRQPWQSRYLASSATSARVCARAPCFGAAWSLDRLIQHFHCTINLHRVCALSNSIMPSRCRRLTCRINPRCPSETAGSGLLFLRHHTSAARAKTQNTRTMVERDRPEVSGNRGQLIAFDRYHSPL